MRGRTADLLSAEDNNQRRKSSRNDVNDLLQGVCGV